MYAPKYAIETDTAAIKEFIHKNGFGILVSNATQKLIATHIPLKFSLDESKLLGHISRANRQWETFNPGVEVLTIFNGPHAYVSSSWYDHENVPTWNYIAAHVYGHIRIIEGDELYLSLKHLTHHYESPSDRPVTLESMSPAYVHKAIQGLVGFEIEITSMEATYKLSQNRDQKNYENIVRELEKKTDEGSHQIANEMKKRF